MTLLTPCKVQFYKHIIRLYVYMYKFTGIWFFETYSETMHAQPASTFNLPGNIYIEQ